MAWDKNDRSYKILINKRVTANTKASYEELGDRTINVHLEEVWAQSISITPVQAVSDGVAELRTLFTLTEDTSVANHLCYYAFETGNRLKDWISDKYGSGYSIRLFQNNGTEIFPTDTSTWFFDYPTGILTLNSSNGLSLPLKVTGYRYIGTKGDQGVTGVGGAAIYAGASPSTVTVGGLSAGTTLTGLSSNSILELILCPYIAPAFTSFSISGQTTALEVGTSVSGSKTFTWGFSNIGNVTSSSMSILDVTGAATLASSISITPTYSVSVGTIQLNSPGSYSWRGQAINTHSGTFQSGYFSIGWYYRIFYGTSSSVILGQAAILALANNGLASSFSGNYSFAAGDYKYFTWPDSFGSPTATTGFKDTSTNLGVAMADNTDNAAYSNTQNGWYYAIVSVMSNGVTANYRVYRTKNLLGGSITIGVN